MTATIEHLTDKEKEALRLILTGHDAKSAANSLQLSVHAINDRLRSCRRKLSVTSSREAARLLLEEEGPPPEMLAGKHMGDVPNAIDDHSSGPSETHSNDAGGRRRIIAGFAGVLLMLSFVLAAVLSSGVLAEQPPSQTEKRTEREALDPTLDQAVEQAAREWLALVDARDWQASFDAMGPQMRQANTLEGWTAAAKQAHGSLGPAISRKLTSTRYVNAPPKGYREIVFATDFADRSEVIETVTLEKQAGVWKVVGVMLD